MLSECSPSVIVSGPDQSFHLDPCLDAFLVERSVGQHAAEPDEQAEKVDGAVDLGPML
jgi:hypothetical protein